MFRTLSQIQWSYKKCSIAEHKSIQKLKFIAGHRLPYILINDVSVYKLLTEPAFHLLIIGDTKPISVRSEFVKTIFLGMEEWAGLGVTQPLYILVRPDNYIGLLADEMNEEILNNYLQQHCYFITGN